MKRKQYTFLYVIAVMIWDWLLQTFWQLFALCTWAQEVSQENTWDGLFLESNGSHIACTSTESKLHCRCFPVSLTNFLRTASHPVQHIPVTCLNESYLLEWKLFKIDEKCFYFTLKSCFVLEIFKFLPLLLWSCKKMAW